MISPDMLAVKVDLFWPLDSEGFPVRKGDPGTSITYYTAAKTGPAWQTIDPEYIPKIEY